MEISQTTPTTPESSSKPPTPVTVPGLRVGPPRIPYRNPEPIRPPAGLPPHPDPIDGSPTPSTADSPPRPRAGAGVWKDLARGLVASFGEVAHERLAVTEDEQRARAWQTTPKDQAAIGDPLADIAERHGLPATDNEDINDLIASGMGILAWLIRNIPIKVRARILARRRDRIIQLEKAEQARNEQQS